MQEIGTIDLKLFDAHRLEKVYCIELPFSQIFLVKIDDNLATRFMFDAFHFYLDLWR